MFFIHKQKMENTESIDNSVSLIFNIYEQYFWSIISVFAGGIFGYYFFWLPQNWRKGLYSVGYGFIDQSNRELNTSIIRRARKIGKLPPVFPNGWFAIAEVEEVKPGSVIYRTALGENLAIFRSQKGICHVLDAYCPHIGANMAIGGKVYDNCLECPFHGWRFDGTSGKCVYLPYDDKIPKFLQVRRWIVHETNDLIFIWYHAEKEEPTWYPNSELAIESKEYTFRGRNEYFVNCHIQEIPENGGDLCHFNMVHGASLLVGSDLRKCESKFFQFFKHVWTAKWNGPSDTTMSYKADAKLEHKITLFGKIDLFSTDIHVCQYGPAYVVFSVQTTFGTVTILQTVTPLEPLLQKIVHRIYSPPLLFWYATIMLKAECIMVERDIMVWNHKRFLENPVLLKLDKTIAKFRRWYSQFYSEHSPHISDLNPLEW